MNLRTTEMKTAPQRKKNSARHNRNKNNFSIVSLFKIGMPILIIFLLAAAMNVFNSETEALNRRSVKLQMEINKLERDIANYNIKCEKLKGRFIYKQVALFKLKLHSPIPGQVRRLNLPARNKMHSSYHPEPLLISQR